MMRIFYLTFVALLVGALPVSAQNPMPIWPSSYSADVTVKGNGMPRPTKMRYAINGGNMRIEMNEGGPKQMIMITNADKKASYVVMPEQKMYMQTPFTQNPMPKMAGEFTTQDAIDKAQPKYIGQETVNGVSCNKYAVQTEDGTVFTWISEQGNYPVRIASENGDLQVDWSNVTTDTPAASEFLPPAGYRTMSLPGGMGLPSGLMPGGGAPQR